MSLWLGIPLTFIPHLQALSTAHQGALITSMHLNSAHSGDHQFTLYIKPALNTPPPNNNVSSAHLVLLIDQTQPSIDSPPGLSQHCSRLALRPFQCRWVYKVAVSALLDMADLSPETMQSNWFVKKFVDLEEERKSPEGEVRWESLKDQTTYPEDLNRLHLPWRPWWSNWFVWKFVDLVKETKYPEGDIWRESLKDQTTYPEDLGGAQGPT